jgi:outer membrane protein assembly factor BamB
VFWRIERTFFAARGRRQFDSVNSLRRLAADTGTTGFRKKMTCLPNHSRLQALAAWLVAVATLTAVRPGRADDWLRFRGPNGSGISDAHLPTTWSETENLRWKAKLPGFGSSSPIVVGSRVFVTCYSGYGVGGGSGHLDALRRHLVCVARGTGQILWTQTVNAGSPEDDSSGYLTEHGYASNTLTSDGERVYVFFGKSGVIAFDLEGKKLWTAEVGKESSDRRWGSAASLILCGDLLVVNASEESNSIRALDKRTGKQVWKAEAKLLELAYGTPALVTAKARGSDLGRADLVLAVPGEVWGLDPDCGKLRWRVETRLIGNMCPSPVVDGDTVYVFGGIRSSGSCAIRSGGKGNVTSSNTLWSSRNSSYVSTPLLHANCLYWVDDRGLVPGCCFGSDQIPAARPRFADWRAARLCVPRFSGRQDFGGDALGWNARPARPARVQDPGPESVRHG